MLNLYLINLTVIGLSLFNFVNSQISTTTSVPASGCPGGGVAYQDIAVLYDLTFFPDNSSMSFSQQISNAIGTILFSGSAYQYYQADGITRATQITPLPFPETDIYNVLVEDYSYGGLRSDHLFKSLLQDQVRHSQINMFHHPTDSKISDALWYVANYEQMQRRPAPVANTIVIISKRDSDVANSKTYTDALKLNGSKIMTIGVGNGSLSNLASLSSGTGYNFMIPDITDTNVVNNVAQQMASKLFTDCGITWTPLPSTTPLPTTPYTGSTTTPQSTTTGTLSSTVSTPVTPFTGSSSSSSTTVTPPAPVTTTMTSTVANGTIISTTPTTTPTSNASTPTTTPTSTTPPTTTPKNQYRSGRASAQSFSSFILFLSFLYTFVNLF